MLTGKIIGLAEGEIIRFDKGEVTGIDKSKDIGKQERNIEIVKEMLNKNMDINLISELTKLIVKEINKIRKDIK